MGPIPALAEPSSWNERTVGGPLLRPRSEAGARLALEPAGRREAGAKPAGRREAGPSLASGGARSAARTLSSAVDRTRSMMSATNADTVASISASMFIVVSLRTIPPVSSTALTDSEAHPDPM
jgi:hypothetical protein